MFDKSSNEGSQLTNWHSIFVTETFPLKYPHSGIPAESFPGSCGRVSTAQVLYVQKDTYFSHTSVKLLVQYDWTPRFCLNIEEGIATQHATPSTSDSILPSLNISESNLMSLAILFHFLYAQHVLDFNISIIRSLRLFC